MRDLAHYIEKSYILPTVKARFSHLMVCVIICNSWPWKWSKLHIKLQREMCEFSHQNIHSY